ncbi:MAG: MEDS domain-containing protein [Pirellulaceae bacterium]
MIPSAKPNFSVYKTVGEAASFLGVSTATLRNWDRSGKLKPRRHPQNGYRIYLHEDLEAVLCSADVSNLTDESFAPHVDWSLMGESDHFVQFYENDDYLIDSVSGFVGAGLTQGKASVVIATAEHRDALQRKLAACGVQISQAESAGQYILLDAAETLAKFMVDGSPDPQRFKDTVGAVIAQLASGERRIHAFGEMVALLWADGNREAAIRLEELWNELSKQHRFALFCAYPIQGFDDETQAEPFRGVCSCHSRVIPAESYAALHDPDDRLRAISLLQQKAQSLEAEIAHRVEVEQVLVRRERELADFFENATEGLHKVGADGTILWANKAEYTLLGYAAEEYIGRSITEFHADPEVIAEILRKLRQGEILENYPARLRCKDGSIKHVLINSSACFEDEKFAYTRCFTRDVTRRFLAEQALRDADRRKDEFLATLAHELRNPLAPIRNALEVLRIGGHDEAVSSDVRSIMDRQVQQLTRLVDDLLDISRITRDRIELRKQRVDLATIVKTAVETSRPLMEAAGHELTITLPGQPIMLYADPTRLAQIFSNLLNNSAKYTEPGGQIQIEARLRGREVAIFVRDNGVGIACDALAYVFDMFRQVDESLERSQGGLGIGLTLVRRLVELHGGTINALSDGPGKGSEFVVRLPMAGGEADSAAARAAPSATVPKRRILVVDDNKDSADTLSTLLRIKGHDVRTAGDGLQAIDVASEFSPEVILMDVGMPKMNGYDATRRIRQLPGGQDVFVIALTGWGQENDVQRSADAGCSAHLVKPVDLAALELLLIRGTAATR